MKIQVIHNPTFPTWPGVAQAPIQPSMVPFRTEDETTALWYPGWVQGNASGAGYVLRMDRPGSAPADTLEAARLAVETL